MRTRPHKADSGLMSLSILGEPDLVDVHKGCQNSGCEMAEV